MPISGGMDEENVVHVHNRILFGHDKEGNPATCDNMDGSGRHFVNQRERHILYDLTYMWDLNTSETHRHRVERWLPGIGGRGWRKIGWCPAPSSKPQGKIFPGFLLEASLFSLSEE